jgi:hypothetical protein
MSFSKCRKCGIGITEEDWFDFSQMCAECSLEEDIRKSAEVNR